MQEDMSTFDVCKNLIIKSGKKNEVEVRKKLQNLFEAILNGVDNLAASSKKEKDGVNERTSSFDYENSKIKKLIDAKGWTGIGNDELKKIAAILSSKIKGISLNRDEKRRKKEIILWYERNFEQISDVLNSMELSKTEFKD